MDTQKKKKKKKRRSSIGLTNYILWFALQLLCDKAHKSIKCLSVAVNNTAYNRVPRSGDSIQQ